MKRHTFRLAAAGILLCLLSGCSGNDIREWLDADLFPQAETVPSETVTTAAETTKAETTKTAQSTVTEAETTKRTTTTAAPAAAESSKLYSVILNLFYDNISEGWTHYQSVGWAGANDPDPTGISCMWTDSMYEPFDDLSKCGYQFIDLNGDGTEELIVGTIGDDGTCYPVDLYTYYNGQTVHLASDYYRTGVGIRADATVVVSQYAGAANADNTLYRLEGGRLKAFAQYVYDGFADADNPWFYSDEPTTHTAAGGGEWTEFQNLRHISEQEFENAIQSHMTLHFTRFSSYPRGAGTPAGKKTYQECFGAYIFEGDREMIIPGSSYAAMDMKMTASIRWYYLGDIDGDGVKDLIVDYTAGGTDEFFRVCYKYRNGNTAAAGGFSEIYLLEDCWISADGRGLISLISQDHSGVYSYGEAYGFYKWIPDAYAGSLWGDDLEEIRAFPCDPDEWNRSPAQIPSEMRPYLGQKLTKYRPDDRTPLKETLP